MPFLSNTLKFGGFSPLSNVLYYFYALNDNVGYILNDISNILRDWNFYHYKGLYKLGSQILKVC